VATSADASKNLRGANGATSELEPLNGTIAELTLLKNLADALPRERLHEEFGVILRKALTRLGSGASASSLDEGAEGEPETQRQPMQLHERANEPVDATTGAQTAKQKSKTTLTAALVDRFGSRPVTYMTHFVILAHILSKPNAASIRSVFSTLVESKLVDRYQRPSVVTGLNRMKRKKAGLIAWPEGSKGEDLQVLPEGVNYLGELLERRLDGTEFAYIRENCESLLDFAQTYIKAGKDDRRSTKGSAQ
jgi:hypothetical protein